VASNEFDDVREEPDPLLQARRATELMNTYQQRGVELARLRKEAIRRAVDTRGLTYAEVARLIGLSKGRITQIRQGAPAAERVLFGVGPLTVAYPVRASADRPSGVVAVEDSTAAEGMTALLRSLAFTVEQFLIPPDGHWDPPAGAVVICGPKTSTISAEALEADPWLSFHPDSEGRWAIQRKDTGAVVTSPIDGGTATADVAYVGRLPFRDRSLFLIAGVHALGSAGAVQYLTDHLADLYAVVGERSFSVVVGSTFDGPHAAVTKALWGPTTHA
jgi:hypothetical protein